MSDISVIMATYNGELWLSKQLDSILNQTLPPDEIIICDDRSTDATHKILASYARYPQVRFVINDQQLGVTSNFKKACSLCKPNNYIAFADQDDMWVPGKLHELRTAIESLKPANKPALVFSDLSVIDAEDQVIFQSFWERQRLYIGDLRFRSLLFGNVVTGCTMMINPAMSVEFQKIESSDFLHDAWIALIAYSIGEVKVVKKPLVLYRQHATNLTFSEGYEGPSIWNSVKAVFNFTTGKKKFLAHRIPLAKKFERVYGHQLNAKDSRSLKKFIGLEHQSYPKQRLHRYLAGR
jgi:glycosyltransferase involved in cell wall biosynthesis